MREHSNNNQKMDMSALRMAYVAPFINVVKMDVTDFIADNSIEIGGDNDGPFGSKDFDDYDSDDEDWDD